VISVLILCLQYMGAPPCQLTVFVATRYAHAVVGQHGHIALCVRLCCLFLGSAFSVSLSYRIDS